MQWRANGGYPTRTEAITRRGRIALRAAKAASWASQKAGRGKGSMIGGLIALKIDPTLMSQLGRGRRTVLITGTNGKSTTTRMTAAALATLGPVATQADGANMDAGIVAALSVHPEADLAAIEVDELHLPHVSDAVAPESIVLLNLSRDQLDRVGEINMIERRLRAGLARHPDAVVVANCDDVLMTSAAYDSTNVVWVAAGSGWGLDATSCPRSGEPIAWENRTDEHGTAYQHWYSTGTDFARPTPHWWVDEETLYGPEGLVLPMKLTLPGRANRGNAAQAVAAAVALGADPGAAVAAASTVDEVAGRYRTTQVGPHSIRMLLAKNPAGWQEALSMIDPTVDGLVIAVNGQVPDGEDLSWLWDVRFEHFEGVQVVAAGERGTDLGVRLTYAGVEHTLVKDPVRAIATCPPGRVEVLANYTAFRDLNRALETGAG
ncbi:Mur ligase family protein [Aldersonia sp. NBC_00410]|uniref:Mur ligase family protein n=1 Tax=Aldersonia sp. NBC_00410 TaxID=2975954 RepID=UPI0022506493|nr:Mur ligase family protein [Aldersonia sp. NBC_00410]MCX5043091.1 Mur ligase family protein [Aldersonia sp. NBC_00410]